MRLLVVGSGGREHALVEALSRSQQAEEIFAAPGNPGMASVAELVDIPVDDLISLRNFARTVDIDLTIVGPEAPLVGGIAEAFWEAGLKIFGPSRGASRVRRSLPKRSCNTPASQPPALRPSTGKQRRSPTSARFPLGTATPSSSRWTDWRRARAL